MTLRFGGIADDLTGGLELASVMVAQGESCPLVTAPQALDTLTGHDTAVVVAMRTRLAPAVQAVERVDAAAAALLARGAPRLFFKYCATFDSTPAGNIGPCADALMRRAGAAATGFCPSFPEVARTVYQGHLFVADRLVSESPKRFDPATPMTDPDLVRVLQAQTRQRVGLLPHEVILRGVEACRAHLERLAASGVACVIFDAVDEANLVTLAELTADWPVMTGGSSIAVYYPRFWRARPAAATQLPAVYGPAVVLAGSCADRTREQLSTFEVQRPVLRLDPVDCADDPDAAVAMAVDWATARWDSGPVAVATSATPEAVERAKARLGAERAGRLPEQLLGALAAALRGRGARRFLVAGGETSGAVVEALGIRRLDVEPYEIAGVHRAVSAEADPVSLHLKSGKLGPVDMFLSVLGDDRPGRHHGGGR